MKNYYFKSHGLLLARSPGWELDHYGFPPNGIGDAIGRSCKAALAHNDPEMLQLCVDLLKTGKRWPDVLNPASPYPGKYPEAKKAYRKQTSITRDPIIGTICALWLMPGHPIILKWRIQIKDIKIRWWQNRPDLYHWKKYLETGKHRYKRKYEFWAAINLLWKPPMYSLYHMAWMSYVADSQKMKSKLWDHIPIWNYLLRELTNHPLKHLHRTFAKNYRAKNGYQWQAAEWIKPPEKGNYYLNPDDTYKLDKDILNYIKTR